MSPASLESTCTSITVPPCPCLTFNEVSLTGLVLCEKIAATSLSSEVGFSSPFGDTLPTRMSPARTSDPTLMIPFSSRFLLACVETFGISFVNSSSPALAILN